MKQNKKSLLFISSFLVIGLMFFSYPKKADAGFFDFFTNPIGTFSDAVGDTSSLNDLALADLFNPIVSSTTLLLGIPVDPIRDIAIADIATCEVNFLFYTGCTTPDTSSGTIIDYPSPVGSGCPDQCYPSYCGNTCYGYGPDPNCLFYVGSDCNVHCSSCGGGGGGGGGGECTQSCGYHLNDTDAQCYLDNPSNYDLRQFCADHGITDCITFAKQHWLDYGCHEGRDPCCSSPPPPTPPAPPIPPTPPTPPPPPTPPAPPVPLPGDCGNATSQIYCQKPTQNLCTSGSLSSVSANGNRWKWQCGSEPCYALKSCAYQEVSPN